LPVTNFPTPQGTNVSFQGAHGGVVGGSWREIPKRPTYCGRQAVGVPVYAHQTGVKHSQATFRGGTQTVFPYGTRHTCRAQTHDQVVSVFFVMMCYVCIRLRTVGSTDLKTIFLLFYISYFVTAFLIYSWEEFLILIRPRRIILSVLSCLTCRPSQTLTRNDPSHLYNLQIS
jgi:hypothetical protein